jgi:hypothetical protein
MRPSILAGFRFFAAGVCLIGTALALLFPQNGRTQTGTIQPNHASAQQDSAPPASTTEAMYRAAADSARRKLQHIEENGRRAQPDQTPTVLTENEMNAYLASGQVQLPKGVRSARFRSEPGIIHANANVDFDAITAEKRPANPWLALFRGTHDVEAMAHASGSGHEAHVHIDSVVIDGVGVPRVALQYFIERYLKPRYPNAGLDSTFQMPARIDTAALALHRLTVTQK